MKRRGFLAVVVALFGGCLSFFEDDEDPITEPGDIVVVADALRRTDTGTEDERAYVRGIIRNEGDRELNYLEIAVTFLDAEGEELDTIIEHVEDVTRGETWSFEVEYPRFGEDAALVADYELEPSTGI